MSVISIEDVKKIASLAKLEFSDDELKDFSEQFKKIVGFVEKISELNTTGIEPMVYPMENKNITREDIVKPSMPNEEIEKNAPEFNNGSIIVPKIIEY
ncbi:MAG: Asp-tRNA(Asn)/Glu-tRNA(Gln) amidotransferase subunit GatC [Brevinematia bacterium]